MLLNIVGRGLKVDETARERIERRLRFALGRFGGRVERVTVRLTDVNGPRGGVDKRCRIVVEIIGHGPAIVEEMGSELKTMIDRAADRVGHFVRRNLERSRLLAQLIYPRPVEANGKCCRHLPPRKKLCT